MSDKIREECFVCAGGTSAAKGDDIALCNGHWNRWLLTFVADPFAPEPPCGAHLIIEAEES